LVTVEHGNLFTARRSLSFYFIKQIFFDDVSWFKENSMEFSKEY